MSLFRLIIATEFRQFVRQPIALWMMILLPFLPTIGLEASDTYNTWVSRNASDEDSSDGPKTYAIHATEEAAPLFAEADGLTLVLGSMPEEGSIGEGDPLVMVHLEDHTVVIEHRDDVKRSARAASRVESHISTYNDRTLQAALSDAGRPEKVESILALDTHDLASDDDTDGTLPVMLMGMLFMVMSVFSLFTGLDIIAGEKERGTGETLLSTSADRHTILMAKAATVGIMSIGSGIATVAVLLAGSLLGMELQSITGGPFVLSGAAWMGLMIAAVLLGVQLTACNIMLGAAVPDYRTGSMVASPAMLVLMSAPALAAAPSVVLNGLVAVTPFLGIVVALRDAMAGTLVLPMAGLAFVANLGHTALLLWLAARRFDRPDALIPSSGTGGRRLLGDYRAEAFATFVIAVAGFWYLGTTTMILDAMLGIVISQLGVFATIGLVSVWWVGLPVASTLSLRRPHPKAFLQAMALGLTTWCLSALLTTLLDPILPMSTRWAESLRDMVVLDDYPMLVMLFCTSLLPGVCEELLFRGALLGMLRNKLSDRTSILLTAIAFGLMHMSLVRMVPTTLMGLCLGLLTVRSGSLWPAMLAHGLNNALLTVLSRQGIDPDGYAGLVTGAILCLLTLFWITRQPEAEGAHRAHR